MKGNNEENGRRTDEEADNETEEEDEDDTGEVFSQILPSLKIAADRPAILVLRPTSSSTTKANLDECVSGKAVSRTILALKPGVSMRIITPMASSIMDGVIRMTMPAMSIITTKISRAAIPARKAVLTPTTGL